MGAARANPQGSFHYGSIKISRTISLENGVMMDRNKLRYTINGVSFVHPDTPLKLADYYRINQVFTPGIVPDMPDETRPPTLGTSVIDALYHDFLHVVLYNPLSQLQSWHLDGYSFFVVGSAHFPTQNSLAVLPNIPTEICIN